MVSPTQTIPPPLEKYPAHGHLLRTPPLSPVWAHFIPVCTVYAHVFTCVREQSSQSSNEENSRPEVFALPHKVMRKTMSPLSRKPTTVVISADTGTDFLSLLLAPTLMLWPEYVGDAMCLLQSYVEIPL